MSKLFSVLFAVTLLLSSCWYAQKDTPPRELAQGVYQEEVIKVPDSVMKWNVEKKQYVKEYGFVDKVVPIKEFEVMPPGAKVKQWAKESGQDGLNLIGIVIALAVAAAGIFGGGYFSSSTAKTIVRIAAVLVAIAIGLFTNKPANIAQNNAKTITERQLKHYQAIDPELSYFWDSVYNAGGIIGAKKK